jgi:hypothetical protein
MVVMKKLMVGLLVMPQLILQDALLFSINIVKLTLKNFGNGFGMAASASS